MYWGWIKSERGKISYIKSGAGSRCKDSRFNDAYQFCRKNIYITDVSVTNEYSNSVDWRGDKQKTITRTATIKAVLFANPNKSYGGLFEIEQLIEDIAILRRYVKDNYIATNGELGVRVDGTIGAANIDLLIICKDKEQEHNVTTRFSHIVHDSFSATNMPYYGMRLNKIEHTSNVKVSVESVSISSL